MTTMLEKLMALLDGELVPADGAAVVREAARMPNLESLLAICTATARTRMSRPYAALAAEPAPAYLVDMIMRAPIATSERRPARQVSYGRALLASLKHRYQVPGWSLAAPAMATLLVALALGWLMLPILGLGREVAAGVGIALEKVEPGKEFAVATIRPVRTFPSKDGRWCRQSEVHFQGTKQMSYRLDCRDDAGTWSLQTATALGPNAPPRPSGHDTEPEAPVIDPRKAVNDRAEEIKGGDAVFGDAERELIRKGWPSPRR